MTNTTSRFILTMPGTLVLIHATISTIPGWLQRKHMPGRAFTAVATGLLAACAGVQFLMWDRASQAKTLAFGERGDQIYVLPELDERALPTLKTFEYLRRTLRHGEADLFPAPARTPAPTLVLCR